MSSLSEWSVTKRALLEARLRGQAKPATGIARQAGPCALSFAQQRLWFLHRLAPQSAVYNVPVSWRIDGDLDVAALEQALGEILRRHEVLRSRYAEADGAVTIDAPAPFRLPLIDLETMPPQARQLEAKRLAEAEALRPFDLAQGPVVRVLLLRLAKDSHVLLATLHHIVSDGWSAGVLLREIQALYSAYRNGLPSPLPPLPIQYSDFAHWQRNRLQGEAYAALLAYWKDTLADMPALDFPADAPRPAAPSFQGAAVALELPQGIGPRLKHLARGEGVTLFTLLTAAFHAWLHRYTGQTDLATGTVIANRNRPEIEGLIGFFVNTLVLRGDVAGNPSFRELLRRTDRMLQGAYAHQDMPFDKLVEGLRLPRDFSRNPLFQVSLSLGNVPTQAISLDGLSIAPVEPETLATQFDLTLHFEESCGELVGSIVYGRELFSEARVRRVAGQLRILLEGIAADPDVRIADLPLLTAADCDGNRRAGTGPALPVPAECRLHHWFERQAKRTPDKPAVACGSQRLSYRELDERAGRLANYLAAQGVGPDSRIGVCLERSVGWPVAIFGILKAGAAYVPVDPAYPAERKAHLLQDCGAAWLLTEERWLDGLPDCVGNTVCLERDWPKIAAWPEAEIHAPAPDNLAYVIYTSGSTGQPKGVQISHANAVHSTLARLDYYTEPVGAFLLLSSFAFDSSVAGIFWTLGQGGCLCLPEDSERLDPHGLAALIEREQVTHLLCLPSLYGLLLEQGRRRLDSLRVAIVAGEACPAALAASHFKRLPNVALCNEYGPTEASVWCSAHRLSPVDIGLEIPIGKPIANAELLLLDHFLNPVPFGAAGELHVGGPGLSRGYLRQPERTAQAFIPHPAGAAGARLYKTGDLARFRADGSLEFLGRIDDQVKIRGFRIEPGEIERRLLAQPQIGAAAVVVQDGGAAGKRLAAFAVGADGSQPDPDTLLAGLRQSLPDYMVPASLTVLDALPLTPNGKTDRAALAKIAPARVAASSQAPRTPTEEAVACLWKDALGLEVVGVFDNFFELGGHSMAMMGLLLKLDERFGLRLPPRGFFGRPTVAALAEWIDQGGPLDDSTPEAVDLEQEAWLNLPAIGLAGLADNPPQDILLTGATGFLGAFLLQALLEQTGARIHCLVRAKTPDEAKARLRRQCQRYEIELGANAERIVPVCGDLAAPGLGLETGCFEQLAEQIDAIYHNGALVNFTQPYAAMKPANVEGTREVVRLACSVRRKPLHYVSTLSVFGNAAPASAEGFGEDDFPGPEIGFGTGYAQSKWVAERIVRLAADAGLPVTIHRPATVAGHSVSGAWNTDDLLCRLLKGCVGLGLVPQGDYRFDAVSVDYVANAIVFLSAQPGNFGKTFHFNNADQPLTAADMLAWMDALGHPLRTVPYPQWREALFAEAAGDPGHTLHPLLNMFPPQPEDEPADAGPRYGCRKTLAALEAGGIVRRGLDMDAWRRCLGYFGRVGFIAPLRG